jgi:hypothetical protein
MPLKRNRKENILSFFQKACLARHWWLTPIILATWEAQIRRIMVQNQSWASSSQDPILKTYHKKRLVEWHKQ